MRTQIYLVCSGRLNRPLADFSNVLKKSDIERLAEADEHEVVKEVQVSCANSPTIFRSPSRSNYIHLALRLPPHVQEYFADYVPINPDLFSLNLLSPPHPIWGARPNEWDPTSLERHTAGLGALLLSLKKKPVVRYERMSALAKKLGEEITVCCWRRASFAVSRAMRPDTYLLSTPPPPRASRLHTQYQMTSAQPGLYDFRRTDVPPLLLILDRRNDPVTPLLSQWTYQAMVHELIGINNGRVSLADAEGIRPELKVSLESHERHNNCIHLTFTRLVVTHCRKLCSQRTKTPSFPRTSTTTSAISARPSSATCWTTKRVQPPVPRSTPSPT